MLQVAEILKKSENLKKQIEEYQAECMAKVDSYTAGLIEEVAKIEREQMLVRHFLREKHTAQIVKGIIYICL